MPAPSQPAPRPFSRPLLEYSRSQAKATFTYGEAFALMKYESPSGEQVEWLWNSRDGVTPFCIDSAPEWTAAVEAKLRAIEPPLSDYEFLMQKHEATTLRHVSWELDRCLPFYRPSPGERVFVDWNREAAVMGYTRRVDKEWLADDEAAKIEAEIAELETLHKPLFEESEAHLTRWMASFGTPDEGKIERPEYSEENKGILTRAQNLESRLNLRRNYPDKAAAVAAMVEESLKQLGAPHVVTGAFFAASDELFKVEAEAKAISIEAQAAIKGMTPEEAAPVVAGFDARVEPLRERFANELILRRAKMREGKPSPTGGIPVMRPKG